MARGQAARRRNKKNRKNRILTGSLFIFALCACEAGGEYTNKDINAQTGFTGSSG
jgi:hypothetical protein